ncbi:MAG: DMT family transporter [Pseudomonadota bacterium]
MLAFAANSVLCRLALGAGEIDAASFASVRLLSAAAVLAIIVLLRDRSLARSDINVWSALALFGYVVFFSFAYLTLATGTGALILFGAVQLTMFAWALKSGERFPALSWFGLALAIAGLVYLLLPGVAAPDPMGATMMAIAGVSWGVYSLLGRAATDATRATAWNFVLALPLGLVTSLFFMDEYHVTANGLLLAVISGALTSGLGYVAWYSALTRLATGDAATIQLSVPVIAAVGGVLLLSEPVTLRLIIATLATLGGVAIVLRTKRLR